MQFDNSLLKHLIPVRQLQYEHRLLMLDKLQLIELQPGDAMTANEESRWYVYLLKGSINLLDIDKQSELLRASDDRSYHPLFSESEYKTELIAHTQCLVARFDKGQFNSLLDQELICGDDLKAEEVNEVEAGLFNEITEAFNSGQLKLPALPDIASKIKNALLNPATTAEDVARIMLADPVMATKLIHAANSPLVRGATVVSSLHSAVVRLGLKTSKELVMSFAIKELFTSHSKMLNRRMRELYDKSTEIAALGFAISKQSGVLSPDHMLLAGLLHQIGVIPVLNYIEDTGLVITDDNELEQIVKHISGVVGGMVIRRWGLPDDLLAVVEENENWARQSTGEADTCDIILVAQIYYRLKHHQLDGLPKIEQVPAFKKIFKGNQSGDFIAKVFEQANEEVAAVMQMLRM